MQFRVRKADLGDDTDVEDILDLHKLTFASEGALPELHYGHWWLIYPADAMDDPVAFCGISASTYGPAHGYLKRAGVLPGYRGHGLQRRMIRLRERQARKEGWTTIVTDTTDNPHSANNLIECGYRIFIPDGPGWGWARSIYWRRRLER